MLAPLIGNTDKVPDGSEILSVTIFEFVKPYVGIAHLSITSPQSWVADRT